MVLAQKQGGEHAKRYHCALPLFLRPQFVGRYGAQTIDLPRVPVHGAAQLL